MVPRADAAPDTGVAEIEGVCLPVVGWAEDYLQWVDCDRDSTAVEAIVRRDSTGIAAIVERAGALPTPWSDEHAFEALGLLYDRPDMCKDCKERVDEYRQRTGREYPPLYRVSIRVTVEEMPPEFVARYWRDQQTTYATEYRIGKSDGPEASR